MTNSRSNMNTYKSKNKGQFTNPKSKIKLKKVLLIFSICFLVLFGSAFTLFVCVYNKYDLDVTKLTSLNNGIKVYSASGTDSTLYNSNRSIIELSSLPKHVSQAFVDIEDKRFYDHHGYDLKRIVKAGFVNLTTKSKSQGASTISQQLIKNALLSNEKTYERKIKEIMLSIKMERKFSKDEILEMYLNTIYFGQNAYGIENASKVYFGKSAKDLTISEACCLAGIIKSPTKYSPKLNLENAISRRNLVAKKMLQAKHITNEEYQTVIDDEIVLNSTPGTDFSYEREAIYEACSLLNISERELINRDYEITTNKNDDLQEQVVKINKNIIKTAEENCKESLDSLSVIVNNEGKIVAYYANSDYNLHNIKRQPASMFKPLAVYLPCFKHNILSPATLILDEPINYNGFEPHNANGAYSGYVSTRDAIANSLNIPAVKALEYVGINKAHEVLADFGFNLTADDLNLSLALGATKYGVSLMQMLSAYNTIANMGVYKPISFIDTIRDKNGTIVYSTQDYNETIIDSASCYLLTDCLRETAKTGTARRLNELDIDVASKTGTAYNGTKNTDLYNVAYTTEYTALSWIADIKNNVLNDNLYSSGQATEINKQILAHIYADNKPKIFALPENVVRLPYDLPEYELNHTIYEPSTSLERYIAYDYFKIDNPPLKKETEQNNLTVTMSKTGSYIYFDTKKQNSYKLMKTVGNISSILNETTDNFGKMELKDNDIFKYDEVNYTLFCNDKEIGSTKIRPKEYIFKLLETEMLNGKTRWSV